MRGWLQEPLAHSPGKPGAGVPRCTWGGAQPSPQIKTQQPSKSIEEPKVRKTDFNYASKHEFKKVSKDHEAAYVPRELVPEGNQEHARDGAHKH
jgi:hypothetical protein